MDIARYADELQYYLMSRNGHYLADLLSLRGSHVLSILQHPEKGPAAMEKIRSLPGAWSAAVIPHLSAVAYQSKQDYQKLYHEQSVFASTIIRIISEETAWCLPVIYTTCRELRNCAILADLELSRSGRQLGKLEEAARVINKAFTACLSDRARLEESRKWGTYYIVGLLFKTYFKLKSTALCRNVLRAMQVSGLPPLELYPKAHQITYRVHMGILAFLDEDYKRAEVDLAFAFVSTPKVAKRNRSIILDYLIPTLMIKGIMPAPRLLKEWSRFNSIYGPIIRSIRSCHVGHFDRALLRAQPSLVESGVYLTVERTRKLCIRRLVRLVWLLAGRPSRLEVALFEKAFSLADQKVDVDGMECILVDMIYEGYIKGYLSRDQHKIVLSAKDPFPKLNS